MSQFSFFFWGGLGVGWGCEGIIFPLPCTVWAGLTLACLLCLLSPSLPSCCLCPQFWLQLTHTVSVTFSASHCNFHHALCHSLYSFLYPFNYCCLREIFAKGQRFLLMSFGCNVMSLIQSWEAGLRLIILKIKLN